MCVILDVNLIGRFKKNPVGEDMKPVHQWLENKNGKIVYADTDKFRKEWDKGGDTNCVDNYIEEINSD